MRKVCNVRPHYLGFRGSSQCVRVKPVLFGIDKLEGGYLIDGYMRQAADRLRELVELKGVAQRERQPQPYQVGGRTFLVEPRGRPFYEVMLRHADFILWMTDYEKEGTPPVMVSISSELLWSVGPWQALREVEQTLQLLDIPPTGNKCSRADIMLDWVGRPLRFRDMYDIVCTSRKRDLLDDQFLAPDEYQGYVGQRPREKGLSGEEGLSIRPYAIQRNRKVELTGLVVASGQPLSWRGYNKSLEIERVSGKWWFLDLWRQNGWDPEPATGEYPPVWRSEFQLRRAAITDLAPVLGEPLESMEDVISAVPAIWRYLTGEWLQFRDRSRSPNVTRCPVRAWWRVLQIPDIGVDWHQIDPVERLGRLRRAKRRVLDSMIAGCLAGVAAYQGTAGDLTRTVAEWVATLDKIMVEAGEEGWKEEWGLRARKRARDYLLADLKQRLNQTLRDPDARLPDLVEAVRRWQAELPQEKAEAFVARSEIKRGLLNGGEGVSC